jgi:hypothetical protein
MDGLDVHRSESFQKDGRSPDRKYEKNMRKFVLISPDRDIYSIILFGQASFTAQGPPTQSLGIRLCGGGSSTRRAAIAVAVVTAF